METWLTLLFWLLVGHVLADYPLQGDFLAKAKDHAIGVPGVPWIQALIAHALIHGGAVALVTGSLVLGCAEMVVHAAIDYAKNAGLFNYAREWAPEGQPRPVSRFPGPLLGKAYPNSPRAAAILHAYHIDQLLHVLCKVAWALICAVA